MSAGCKSSHNGFLDVSHTPPFLQSSFVDHGLGPDLLCFVMSVWILIAGKMIKFSDDIDELV